MASNLKARLEALEFRRLKKLTPNHATNEAVGRIMVSIKSFVGDNIGWLEMAEENADRIRAGQAPTEWGQQLLDAVPADALMTLDNLTPQDFLLFVLAPERNEDGYYIDP